jgi:cyclase
MVLSIEAKRKGEGQWEAYYDYGREKTGVDVTQWAQKGCELGAGEILLTSIDMEGGAKGFDIELVRTISEMLPIPVIASGGMGNIDDLEQVIQEGHADAVAMAHVLHYGIHSVGEIKEECLRRGIKVRVG